MGPLNILDNSLCDSKIDPNPGCSYCTQTPMTVDRTTVYLFRETLCSVHLYSSRHRFSNFFFVKTMIVKLT